MRYERCRLRGLGAAPLCVGILMGPVLGDERFFDSDGVRIRYVEQGEGHPIVLIHGYSRSVELTWVDTGILDKLAAGHHVIALDCRGHGKSDKPKQASAYGMQMVEDVMRLLDHLRIRKAGIVGYSMGGRIALKLAASYPDRADRVVLIGAGGSRPGDHEPLWGEIADSLRRGEGIRPLILKVWPMGQTGPTEEEIRALNEPTLARIDPAALAAVAEGYPAFATSEPELARVKAEILAIVGTRDAFQADVDALKKLLPAVRVERPEGAGHLDVLLRPDVIETVLSFVAP